MNIVQVFVSVLLFFILFFGISFILNMLIRKTWLMAFLYPIIVVFIVDNISVLDYFKNFNESIQTALTHFSNIQVVDVIILTSGFLGTIISGVVIKMLRARGYQMF